MIQPLVVGAAIIVAIAALYGVFFYEQPAQDQTFQIFEGPGLSPTSVEQALNKIDKKIVDRDAKTLNGENWDNVAFIDVGDLNAGDINAVKIGISALFGSNGTLDLNILNDTYFDDNVFLLSNITALTYFGDGSNLTGVVAATNWADLNAHLVPYIDATKDVNLGIHTIKAFGDSNFGIVQVLKIFGDGSDLTGVTGGVYLPDTTCDTNATCTTWADARYPQQSTLTKDSTLDNNALAQLWFWTQLNLLIPWADANVANNITLDNITQITNRAYTSLTGLPSIPTETAIDQNALLLDTNWSNTWGVFDANMKTSYISAATLPKDSTLDTNALAQAWFWSRIADLTPWEDANIFTYIPREADIDQNAMLLDTNWSNSWGTFDANMKASYISATTLPKDSALDTNILAQQWFWNRIADLTPWEDANISTYIPREADIDQNAMLLDTNWSNSWGTFDANMKASYISAATLPKDTTCDNNATCTTWADARYPQQSTLTKDSTLDNNALAQLWFWTQLNLLIPWVDANVADDITIQWANMTGKPYVPTEADIDQNAMLLDTNWSNTWGTFDANMKASYISASTLPKDSALDTNILAQQWFWNRIADLTPWEDANIATYIPREIDIDQNAMLLDTNWSNTWGTFDANMKASYISATTLPKDSALDTNAAAQLWFWTQLNLLVPWADANVANNITLDNITQITNRAYTSLTGLPSIPTETAIDQNAMLLDTNWSNTWGTFDANMKASYISAATLPKDSALDTNALAQAWFWNRIADLTPWEDANISTYIPREIDIDRNAMLLDTNWSNTWGLFDANMKASYISAATLPKDTTCDNNAACTTWADARYPQQTTLAKDTTCDNNVDCMTDLNTMYVPYVDADHDLNMGVYGINANDANAILAGIAKIFGSNKLLDLNILNDAYFDSDVNVLGGVFAKKYFGDGGGLTNVTATTNWADLNVHLVPYVDADFDVNIGVYGITANDINVSLVGIKKIFGSNRLLDLNILNDVYLDADLNSLGNILAKAYYQNGNKLMTQIDMNTMYLPFIDTTKDLNLGAYGFKAFKDSNVGTLSIARIYGGNNKLDLNIMSNASIRKLFGGNSFLDLNFVSRSFFDNDVNIVGNVIAKSYFGDASKMSGIISASTLVKDTTCDTNATCTSWADLRYAQQSTLTKDTTCDNNATCTTWADARYVTQSTLPKDTTCDNNTACMIDLNTMYVPYKDADYDLNMGAYAIKAFGDSNVGNVSVGDIYTGPFKIDWNGTALVIG